MDPDPQHSGAIDSTLSSDPLRGQLLSRADCRGSQSEFHGFWSYRFDKKVDLVEKGVTDFVLHTPSTFFINRGVSWNLPIAADLAEKARSINLF
jgi:hypothetical protein